MAWVCPPTAPVPVERTDRKPDPRSDLGDLARPPLVHGGSFVLRPELPVVRHPVPRLVCGVHMAIQQHPWERAVGGAPTCLGNLAALYLAVSPVHPQLVLTGLWVLVAVALVYRWGSENLAERERVGRDGVHERALAIRR